MKASDPHFKLRLPTDIKEAIRSEAAKNRRSLSAQIIHDLETHYRTSRPDSEANEPAAKSQVGS